MLSMATILRSQLNIPDQLREFKEAETVNVRLLYCRIFKYRQIIAKRCCYDGIG
jgi:hypothetical protein